MLAIHRPKWAPNWAVCTWCTTHSTGTFGGSTSGVKNGIPFWQSSTASKERRRASSQVRIIGYTLNRPPSLTILIPSRVSRRAWPEARAVRKCTCAPAWVRPQRGQPVGQPAGLVTRRNDDLQGGRPGDC